MLAVTVPGDPGGTLIFTRMVSQGNSCEFGHYDYAHSFVRSLRIYSRAVHHSNFYVVLAMLISLTVLIAGALMITRHPEWLVTPKTEDQGMQAWTFVLFMVFGVLGIGTALFAMIEMMKKR